MTDLALPPCLQRLPSGIFRLRRPVPNDLRGHFPHPFIVQSYRTKEPKEARRLHYAAMAKLEADFARLRQGDGVPAAVRLEVDGVDAEPWIEMAVANQLTSWLAIDGQELRNARPTQSELQERLHNIEVEASAYVTPADDFREVQPDAVRIMANLPVSIRSGTAAFWALASRLNDARLERGRRYYRQVHPAGKTLFPHRQTGFETVAQGAGGGHRITKDAPPTITPLGQLVEIWQGAKAQDPKTLRRVQHTVGLFHELVGPKGAEEITTADVREFRAKLLASGQTAANVNIIVPWLGTLLNIAVAEDLIGKNPAKGIKAPDPRHAREKRDIFTVQQLNTFFASPVYASNYRPDGGAGEAAYWLPLLSLFTGGRLTELGQLFPDDIVEERYVGPDGAARQAWVARFVQDGSRAQRLKNEGSERRVPIHDALIELGFVNFVARTRAANERIFNKLNPTKAGELTGNFSKWFGRYRRAYCGLTSKLTPFHSFRHSFKHYARQSDIPGDQHDALTGHESGRDGDNYGGMSFPLHPLVAAMKRYQVPGLILPPPPPAIDPAR